MTEQAVEAFLPRDEAQEIELEGPTSSVTFTGWCLAEVSTRTRRSLRWTMMELYRIQNPQTDTNYVLYIIGRSVLFHLEDSDCNSGVLMPFGELPEEAAPCRDCVTQSKTFGDEELVTFEDDLLTIHRCATAAEVIEKLFQINHDTSKPEISRPALRLLKNASIIDPAFNPTSIEQVRL